MTRRKGIALLAVGGLFVSLYLLLYRMGFYGGLACGPGGACEFVQASEYAEFLGLPVAGWGVGWYGAVLGTALVSLQPAWSEGRLASAVLALLAAGGLLFTGYLTWVELFVLEAICAWCVVSAVLVVAISALTLPEVRALRR